MYALLSSGPRRSLAGALILSTALMWGGCSKKESADNTPNLPIVSPETALAGLGLETSGKDALSWANRTGENGTYSYTDVVISDTGDGAIRAEKMTVTGATMTKQNGSEVPSFGTLELTNVTAGDDMERVTITSVSLVGPSPETAAATTQILQGMDDLDFDIENLAFKAATFSDFKMNGEDGESINIARLKMNDVADEKMGLFNLSGVSAMGPAGGSFTLGGVELKNMRLDMLTEGLEESANPLASIMRYDPANPDVTDVLVTDLNFDISGITGAMDSYTQVMTEKGDVQTHTQTMSPLTIKLENAVGPAAMLSGLGYDEFVFSQDWVSTYNKKTDRMQMQSGSLDMKDGFSMSMDGDISGLTAFANVLKAADESGDDFDPEQIVGQTLSFKEFGMTLKNEGLAERALDFAATMQGTTPDRVKGQAKGFLLMGRMGLDNDAMGKMAGQALDAIDAFIDNPGTLKIGFYPKEQLSGSDFISLFEGGDLPDGFVAEAK